MFLPVVFVGALMTSGETSASTVAMTALMIAAVVVLVSVGVVLALLPAVLEYRADRARGSGSAGSTRPVEVDTTSVRR